MKIIYSYYKSILILATLGFIVFLILKNNPNDDILKIKIIKTKQDCETFCQAVAKYNFFYKSPLIELTELNGIYLCSQTISQFKDSWGGQYYVNTNKGIVFSNGPDEKSYTKDDVISSYITSELILTNANIEMNPEKLPVSSAFDIIHLYFNKNIYLGNDMTINLNNDTFVYYSKNKSVIPPPQLMPEKLLFASDGNIKTPTNTGLFYWGKDSTEIVLRFPDGQNDIIIPDIYYINITGTSEKRNNLFKEAIEIEGKETLNKTIIAGRGSFKSVWPILIRTYKLK